MSTSGNRSTFFLNSIIAMGGAICAIPFIVTVYASQLSNCCQGHEALQFLMMVENELFLFMPFIAVATGIAMWLKCKRARGESSPRIWKVSRVIIGIFILVALATFLLVLIVLVAMGMNPASS